MEQQKREALAAKIAKAFTKTPMPRYKEGIASDDALQKAFEGKKWHDILPQTLSIYP